MLTDLCVIMLIAAVTSLVFKLLKQPVVLGYIVAGIIIGPYVIGDSWISNEESVKTWGEIGVLFLLFAMGLEFSFKKLLKMGGTALIASGVIVVGMMFSGFLTGRLLGWNEMNSLFLGGMLSMSSTTIVFKAIDDLGLRSQKFSKICFSILVVEDLFAIILMVILSSIATSRSFQGDLLFFEVLKLVAYLVIWFFIGIVILPTFLRLFRKYLNDELLTIFSIGLCLGMVMLAINAGFSSALGAFVMGSLFAETVEAERIEVIIQPIKNVFGSIFFVSVGMMINPAQLVIYWFPIIIITIVVILGQMLFATVGTLLSGQSLKVSIQTGFSLTQIGEFAFIIATMGMSLGVIDESLYPIVVAVSVITTFLTPYAINLSIPFHDWLEPRLPNSLMAFINKYSSNRNTVTRENVFSNLLKRSLIRIIVYGIVVVFTYTVFFVYIAPFLSTIFPDNVPKVLINILLLIIILTAISPFIWSIALYQIKNKQYRQLWAEGNVQKAKLTGLFLLQLICSISLVSYPIFKLFSLTSGFIFVLSLVFLFIIIISRTVRKHAFVLSKLLDINLSAREKKHEAQKAVSTGFTNSLIPYDIHISDFKLNFSSEFCGKSLKDIAIRTVSGVSVIRIVRNGMNINIPGGDVVLYPNDIIAVAGSDEQIKKFANMLTDSNKLNYIPKRTHVTLERFKVPEMSRLSGLTIKDAKIREECECIVMAIERGNDILMNPSPDTLIYENDIIVVAGETEKINVFVEHNS